MAKKWIEVNDSSSSQYSDNKNIRFKTSMLRSDLWDYSHANIVEKVIINATGINATNKRNKKLSRIMLCLDHVYQKLTTHL